MDNQGDRFEYIGDYEKKDHSTHELDDNEQLKALIDFKGNVLTQAFDSRDLLALKDAIRTIRTTGEQISFIANMSLHLALRVIPLVIIVYLLLSTQFQCGHTVIRFR